MSTKLALAKLCACVCGGAMIGGGAVHVKQTTPHAITHKITKKKSHKKKITRVIKKARVKKYASSKCEPIRYTYFVPISNSLTAQQISNFTSSGGYSIINSSSSSIGSSSSSGGIRYTSSGGGLSTTSSSSFGGISSTSSSSSSSSSSGTSSTSSSSSSSGGISSTSGGTDVPEPPMTILFGVVAIALFNRKFLGELL